MKKKQITVKLDDREIVVEKLPLGKYSELLGAIKELPKHLQQFQTADNNQLISVLPQLLSESLPDVIRIVAIATPLEEKEVEELGLDELSDIVIAVIEVNNYQKVYDNIKKATGQHQPPTKN